MINTKVLVAMTDANQNFSKVVRVVDENGLAVILKNNKPRYVVVDFAEYDQIKQARRLREQKIADTGDLLISQNVEAFTKLTK